MACLAATLFNHRKAGGASGSALILTEEFRTFADLAAALVSVGAGASGSLFNPGATAKIGTWEYDGTDSHLIGLCDTTIADGTEFIEGTDYVLRNVSAAWQTPGASGGLLLTGSGLIEWPCFGLKDGYSDHHAKAFCTFVPGTPTHAQRMGAGSSSLAGDGFVCGGAYHNGVPVTWQITHMWGVPSTMTSLSFAAGTSSTNRIATSGAVLPPEIWLDQTGGGRDGADTLGSLYSRLTRDDVNSGFNGAGLDNNGLSLLHPQQEDHRFCVYFDDGGNGDSSLRLRKLYWDGVRP